MIEPIRGMLDAFDVSCSACGLVERFEDVRYSYLRLAMFGRGWRLCSGGLFGRAGRPYCPDCEPPP